MKKKLTPKWEEKRNQKKYRGEKNNISQLKYWKNNIQKQVQNNGCSFP